MAYILNTDDDTTEMLRAIGLESLIKLVAFLGLGAFALYAIFDGPGDLQHWLDGPGRVHQAQASQFDAAQWRTLLLLFFAYIYPISIWTRMIERKYAVDS